MKLKDALKAAMEAWVGVSKAHPEYTEEPKAHEAANGAAGLSATEDIVPVLLRV